MSKKIKKGGSNFYRNWGRNQGEIKKEPTSRPLMTTTQIFLMECCPSHNLTCPCAQPNFYMGPSMNQRYRTGCYRHCTTSTCSRHNMSIGNEGRIGDHCDRSRGWGTAHYRGFMRKNDDNWRLGNSYIGNRCECHKNLLLCEFLAIHI
jgi:hypothetical protein